MQTINDAAKENCEYHMDSLRQYDKHFIEAFKDGVEFAQRWIPVSEELPKEGQEIICKNSNYKTVLFYYPNGVVDEDFLKANYTHWRPVEYPIL